MNQFDNTPMMADGGAAGPMGWLQTWIKAVSQPNEQTFVEIAESPEAKPQTAYLWVFLGALAIFFVSVLVQVAASVISGSTDSLGGILISMICVVPLGGGFAVLGFMLSAAIIQWVAKMFGGQGNYDKLTYPLAAIYFPISVVSAVISLFSAIPFVGICTGLLGVALSFYMLFLNITAVKAVNRFGWGEAAGSVLLPGLVVLLVCGCLFFVLFAVMGAAFSDVFNQLNQGLQFAP